MDFWNNICWKSDLNAKHDFRASLFTRIGRRNHTGLPGTGVSGDALVTPNGGDHRIIQLKMRRWEG